MPSDAAANISRCVVSLTANRALPEDLRAWLVDGFRRYLDHRGTLDQCLGLNRLETARERGYQHRDRHLTALASHACHAGLVTAWDTLPAAELIADWLSGLPAPKTQGIQRCLEELRQCAIPPPESPRQIYRILQDPRWH